MDKRIDEIQGDENELFIYLKKGWRLALGTSKDYAHCFGVKDHDELKVEMLRVKKCKCHSCSKAKLAEKL